MRTPMAPPAVIALGLCCVVTGWFLQHELSYWQWRGGFLMLAGAVLISAGAGSFVRARLARHR